MDIFSRSYDTTEMSESDKKALKIKNVTLKSELDALENAGVLAARLWLLNRRGKFNILETENLLKLHKQMFGNVWKWAGKLRTGPTNVGDVPAHSIRIELKKLLDDLELWVENKSYPLDLICVMVHHRLVKIHPFANGNGRHSRTVCDFLAKRFNLPNFTWGQNIIIARGFEEAKKIYITALSAADNFYGCEKLLEFARS